MGIRSKTKQKLLKFLARKQEKKLFAQWEHLYGAFDTNVYEAFSVKDLPSESGYYHGELIKWSAELNPNCVLFVGENTETAGYLKDKILANKVLSTGLSQVDYVWNFENEAPVINELIDLIVSHAIFEHLLNPFKHLQDLANIVRNGGHIIIHTVMPGFRYHRYPIDALRFYPDWFEESASRLKLDVVHRRIRESHIFYMYQKNL